MEVINKEFAGSVCVAIPVYKQYAKLNRTELICWQQSLKVLAQHPVCLVSPEGAELTDYLTDLRVADISHRVVHFAPSYFSSIDGYNQLVLSRQFFTQFQQYDYIFLCQLDVFVFQDDLHYWCAKGYSYIGPPWFEGYHPATPEAARLWKVGNGGVTLRKVSDALRALHTFALAQDWSTVVKEHFRPGRLYGYTRLPLLLKALLLGNNTHWALNDFHRHRLWYQEDYFWGVICSERFPWYKVPTPEQALAFGFEVMPRKMYELNHGRLPMACHAWEKYDPAFWKPIIEQYGYRLP